MPVLGPAPNPNRGTAADVTVLARSFMNDRLGRTWTDQALLPFFNSARRQFQRKLARYGVKSRVNLAIILGIPAGAQALSDTSNPGLPGDFVFPWYLEERRNGSSDKFQKLAMATDGIRDQDQAQTLGSWEWFNDCMNFLGATTAMDVRLKYEQAIPALASQFNGQGMFNSNLPGLDWRDSIDVLAYFTAALAARSRGVRTLATDMLDGANTELNDWLARYWKPKQRTQVRRRPYGARLRTIIR